MSHYYRGSSGFLTSIPPLTRNLLLINIIIHLIKMFRPDLFTYYFALYFYNIIHNKYIWQIFTYMFLHGDFWHILFNMYILLILGRELEANWGAKIFLKYYLFCGIGAGIFIFIIDLIFSLTGLKSLHPTIGASGAILGLLLAYGLYYPDRQILLFFFIPIRMKYFLIGTGLVSLFLIFSPFGGNISHAGHLGGIIAGLVYFRMKKRDYNFRPGNNALDDFFARIKRFFAGAKIKIVPEDRPKSSFLRPNPGSPKKILNEDNMTDAEIEEKIDELLDKISRKGLKGLNIEEQLFLDRVSRLYKHKFPD